MLFFRRMILYPSQIPSFFFPSFSATMSSSLGLIIHGVSTSGSGGVAAPKPSSFNNPRFFFQRFSKKPSFSLSPPTVSRPKSIGKTVSCSNREEDVGGFTYKGAGVDIDAGSELVRRIAKMTPGIGGFGGLIPLGDDYLVHSTDGVGTKLMLAIETGIYETIGIDLVAMCVNDIVTSGAKPLSFQDQYSTGQLDVDLAEKVIKGIVDGCKQSGCPLTGGETAEMPDCYAKGKYDLSGSAVGIVKKDSLIDGKGIVVGDVLIGLPSSGVHSNGFSLVRRVLAQSGLSLKDQLPGGSGKPITLGEALMTPTVIYVKQVLDIISKGGVKGVAHITGGGFTDNIPRIFPKGLGATIYRDSWEVPAVFKWIQELVCPMFPNGKLWAQELLPMFFRVKRGQIKQAGRIEDAEMRRTFNMGIGMVLVVSPGAAARILRERHGGYSAYRIGEVTRREGVTYK
ncbi:phosphoribosylformylglycinamidine cyclo-ligase, chloroplastic/mitochondrial [Cinnamomum micranthum f. kanehirae]|uniref:phosphoribosylformylglycinamidine cyclo-ligase n=1 Tax=Cinnamomum micranthum f. kanehirae TaxID=337451 RepID=A0A3S3NEJ7_9MAGN|nr:phosphoribosylformylglycinamidine cyclo-ligase, chloroplastic/mitochondrial [Cinnamomum micranthum f. kanehirae]